MSKNLLKTTGIFLCLLTFHWASWAQTIRITGQITEEDGKAIPGATVLLKGSTIGTSADIDGKYALDVPQTGILVFSFIGYETKEIPIENQSTINVTLSSDISDLEEVVVIGYGTAKKRDITGAVSSVTASKLENENPNSIQDVLRGNVAGLNVGMSTSAKGGGSLEVRGRTSLNAGTSPLLVLDGAIYYGQLSDINPNDIETIEVLKDASSAAVFGAKAANGVIMINTKKGKKGRPRISINSNVGVASVAAMEEVYGPNEFISWREDVFKSINAGGYEPHQFSDPRTLPSDISMETWLSYDGSDGDPVTVWLQRLNMQPEEIKNYKAGKSVDWYNKIFQNGLRQDHTVSLSGKTDDVQYYWSLGYLNNEGIIIGDEFETIRSRFNIQGKISNFLTVGMNTQFASRDEGSVAVDWNNLQKLSPWGSEFNEDGGLKYRPNDEPSGGNHPQYDRNYIDRQQKEFTLNSTLFASVDLPFGFNFRTNFTPRFTFYERFNHESAEHFEWSQRGGNASRQNSRTYYWQIDNILTWKKNFNNIHDFNLTLLANAEKFQSWDNTMSNNGFEPHDRLGYHNIGGGINPIISSNDQYSTGDALMGRLLYTFKDKYSTTLSVRRDGYSAFGQSNPRATFYSLAGAWLFSDETFVDWDWLDFGKLRVSWGSNGNRDIGRYAALSDLNTGKYFYQRPNGELYLVNQLYVNTMSNPNLRWERTNSFNVGLDFSLFKGLLDGSIETYKMSTRDLLVERSLPDILGFNFVYDNLGQVDNKGFELSLNSNNIRKPNFTWRSGMNFQLNRNKIISLYGDVDGNGNELDDIENQWFLGQPIDRIWDLKADGIYQLGDESEAAEYGVHPGDFRLIDVNNDGLFTIADKQFLGYTEPRFRWSLRNEFKLYKNLDISFMLYSYWGHSGSFNSLKNRQGFLDRTNSYITPYWTADNPNNEWARLYSSDGSASFSLYRKKSFIRFENISIAYSLPKQLLEKAKVENLRFYFNVRNIGYYAPQWDWFDPENSGPTPRYFTLGLDLTL
ncbi:TonB-dependent receptor [Echinicola sediminis]